MTKAAYALLNARKMGGLVPPEALGDVPDLEAAYAIQREQVALSGEAIAGWKIGATSAAAQKVLGQDHAVFGPVSTDTVTGSGGSVALREGHGHFIEAEITLRLSQDLPPRATAYTRGEVADAVDAVHASLELVCCRIQSGLAGAGNLVVADFGVNGGAVLGGEIPPEHWDALAGLAVTLRIDGEMAAEGTGGGTGWAHVFDAVAWLAGQQNNMVRPLTKGDIVMTGTCTGVLPMRPGQSLHADFGGLAEVAVSLV